MTTPRRENVPGYSASCRDSCNWEEAARALRVRPFYEGPDCPVQSFAGNAGARSGQRQRAVQRLLSGPQLNAARHADIACTPRRSRHLRWRRPSFHGRTQ